MGPLALKFSEKNNLTLKSDNENDYHYALAS